MLYGMPYGIMDGYGMGYGIGILGLILWIPIIIALVLLIKHLWKSGEAKREQESALKILKKRYPLNFLKLFHHEGKYKDSNPYFSRSDSCLYIFLFAARYKGLKMLELHAVKVAFTVLKGLGVENDLRLLAGIYSQYS